MTTVKHAVKGRSYEYPDSATAEARCKQAVEQSQGKLSYRKEKDGSFTIAPKGASKE
jgi:hypothetical protein